MTTAAHQFGDNPWARDPAKRRAVLSVRITSLDCILVPPGPHDKLKHAVLPNFDEAAVPLRLARVPVIRIFGAVKGSAHRACVHVHDCFPYLLVPYDGVPDHDELDRFICKLAAAINSALALARQHHAAAPKYQSCTPQSHIVAITPVRAVPFYGYHTSPTCFLKIWLADPSNIPRLAELLTSGAILGRAMQAHESHLPYLFQFKADHGLHGMGWLDLAHAAPRAPADRTAHCHVEVDTNAANILNFHRMNAIADDKRSQVSLSAPTSGMSEQQQPMRLIQSLDALWIDEDERRIRLGLPLYTVEPVGTQAGTPPSWDSSDEHLAALRDWLAKHQSRMEEDGDNVARERFLDALPWIYSVEATLAPDPVPPRPVRPRAPPPPRAAPPPAHAPPAVQGPAGPEHDGETNVDVQLTQELLQWMLEEQGDDDQEENEIESFGGHEFVERDLNGDAGREDDEFDDVFPDDALLWSQPYDDQHHNAATADTNQSVPPSALADAPLPDAAPPAIHHRDDPDYDFDSDSWPDGADMDFQFDDDMDWTTLGAAAAPSSSSSTSARIPQYDGADDMTVYGRGTFKSTSTRRTARDRIGKRAAPPPRKFRDRTVDASAYQSILAEIETTEADRGRARMPGIMQSAWSPGPDPGPTSPTDAEARKWTASVRAEDLLEGSAQPRPVVRKRTTQRFCMPPPTLAEIEEDLMVHNLPLQVHDAPFWSKPEDADARPRVFAGREFRIPVKCASTAPAFDEVLRRVDPSLAIRSEEMDLVVPAVTQSVYVTSHDRLKRWTFAMSPPTREEALESMRAEVGAATVKGVGEEATVDVDSAHDLDLENGSVTAAAKDPPVPLVIPAGESKKKRPAVLMSQIELFDGTPAEGATTEQEEHKKTDFSIEKQHMLCMGVEVHVNTREDLLPDPAHDAIQAIYYCLYCDSGVGDSEQACRWGILALRDETYRSPAVRQSEYFDTERGLIAHFVDLVRTADPDVLLGYEIHAASWGYLVERCHLAFKLDLCDELSRIISKKHADLDPNKLSAWGFRKGASFTVTGRIILNVWRLLRSDIASTDYSLSNMAAKVLHRRVPHMPASVLTKWYQSPRTRHRVMHYYLTRALVTIRLLQDGDFLDRTAEFARLYGIDFASVLTRGSQYRVEAILVRLARPMGYVLVSPTKRQVAAQRAAECTPLVMEPVSAFYPDPVIVLDFQSLYPSIMIAFNYCFSTCLGHVPIGGERSSKLGVSQVHFPAHLRLEDMRVSPNGIVFVKDHVRKSTLAQMLTELLDTRVMVKNSMKLHKDNKVLHKVLDARQLGLKLIANVTYGYTAASFSGRMPLVELGDAVVQTGREVLEKAIKMINQHPTWGARVVYGDTDSVFVHLPGATKSRAFQIGKDMAGAITRANIPPVFLKFEKVYLPSILVTKKRYIGHKYESPADVRPVFDAKGVETVRRDGCPVVAKTMRSSLEILFRTRDLTQVKSYLTRQWTKILENRVSIRDFVIAKEVRLGTYSDHVLPPPGAYLAMRKMQRDPRAEPQYAERVPYLVVAGAPGDRLIDQVKCPTSVLHHRELRLNGHYYIHKQIIPALNRLFHLMGVDLAAWYADMPKPAVRAAPWTRSQDADGGAMRATIDRYYRSTRCAACGEEDAAGKSTLCQKCAESVQRRVVHLTKALVEVEDRYAQLARLCADCAQVPVGEVECDALACAVLFDRVKARNRWRHAVEAMVGIDDF
ncbi:DNA polymerase zeta [Allomyces arbusculus]|nr:DNA polymerase zeta [Allomyces arbusculus]